MFNTEKLIERWKPVLDHEDLEPITDSHRRAVTAQLLENTENDAIKENQGFNILQEAVPANATAGTLGANYQDPVLISLVRRAAPKLIAYDIMGVQPMSGPTGLIFSLSANTANSTALVAGALVDEANTDHSSGATAAVPGDTVGDAGTDPSVANTTTGYTWHPGMTTATGEDLAPDYMGFKLDKITVTAKTRALQAHYTMELAQDLKATHGLDAESELAQILQDEILAEINRQAIRTIGVTATWGAQDNVTAVNTFDLDVDANGRWSVEKFKGLIFQMEREANQIGVATRRGSGNLIITSADVASAMAMAGQLDTGAQLKGGRDLNVDVTGASVVGVLNGRFKVVVDPYVPAAADYAIVGYKGPNVYDAGIFYCPYVPLTMMRATVETTYQPKIAFKTRYGMIANPFATGNPQDLEPSTLDANDYNKYYRKFIISNLM